MQKHEHYVGSTHIEALVAEIDGADVAEAIVQYRYPRGGLFDASGRAVETVPGRQHVKVIFRFVSANGHWRIETIETISNGIPA